ncbi:Sds3-like domain containing protein [Rhypophila sp. PSN 637]
MATGDTAPPLALSSSPPPLLDHSPSNLSSPLSDVEDKDGEHDEMDIDVPISDLINHGTPKQNEDGDIEESDHDSESDDDSKLSEVDVNDSEAETERLYDSPRKGDDARDIVNSVGSTGTRQFVDRRDRAFERSPSKLQQQIQADLDAENAASNNNSLSEAEEEEDDASLGSSEPDLDPESTTDKQSQTRAAQDKKAQAVVPSADSTTTKLTRQDSAESRKRKRPSIAEPSESEQPLSKRTGSIEGPQGDHSGDDFAVIDEEGTSTNPQSGVHSAEEDHVDENAEVLNEGEGKAADKAEQEPQEPPRNEKGRRGGSKKQKPKSPQEPSTEVKDDSLDDANDAVDSPAPEDAAPHAEEEQMEDVDEADIAHKNEEELERKRAAWEELTQIEKQFNNFRERLYQERLDQLNQEEAMLTADNPTHPEYLAMLQCLNERRDERVRVSTKEREYRMAMLNRRAVAERAQIMSQFYQAVRESREKVLEELGKEWYDIQQERRRSANVVPDFGIRFPREKSQNIRNAVAYNREVAILSGFAKHVGFPAAPAIHGASEDQLEHDFEEIARARQAFREPPPRPPIGNHQQAVFPPEFTPAGVPFARVLGPAGEQFIEQTPWANPNHPSHNLQRQHASHESTPIVTGTASSSGANRRHSHQPGGMFSSSTTTFVLNGDSPVQTHKAHSHESLKASKMGADQSMKREPVASAS